MPFLFDKFREAGFKRVCEKTWEFYGRYFRWAFVDMDMRGGSWKDFEAKDFLAYYAGIPAILGLLLFFLSCLYSLLRRRSTEREHEESGR